MEFLYEYGLFFAKLCTLLIAALIFIAFIAGMRMREKTRSPGHIEVRHLNEKFRELKESLQHEVLDKFALKEQAKAEKRRLKEEAREQKRRARKDKDATAEDAADDKALDTGSRVYVLNFHGDMRAQAVESLREEITAVLSLAEPADEVVIRLESGGGLVHAYGLAASQLQRVRDRGLHLTACVDKVAASGGYMMAVVADRIMAAPFAIIGSIGVLAQIPNFHRFLKKHDVDFEQLTAGEYKRTLTMLGENTDKGRAKFQQELEDTHVLFKEFVASRRQQLDIDKVATGEIWFGQRAVEQGLVDTLQTSDAYLLERCETAQVYEIRYIERKSLQERIGVTAQNSVDGLLTRWFGRLSRRDSYFS